MDDKKRVCFHSVCDYCGSDMFEYETMDLRWCGCVCSEAIYCMGMLLEMLKMGVIARKWSVVTTDAGQRLGYVYSVVTREDV